MQLVVGLAAVGFGGGTDRSGSVGVPLAGDGGRRGMIEWDLRMAGLREKKQPQGKD